MIFSAFIDEKLIDYICFFLYFIVYLYSEYRFSSGVGMPQHKSAERRVRINAHRRLRNKADITGMKTALKKVRRAGSKAEAEDALKKAVKLLDQLAAKKVIHWNKASNQKSKLTKVVNRMK